MKLAIVVKVIGRTGSRGQVRVMSLGLSSDTLYGRDRVTPLRLLAEALHIFRNLLLEQLPVML